MATTAPVSSNNQPYGTDQQNNSQTPESSLASKEMFLQLFVAQLKNQDPLNPADGTQFVTQLAQFTELEQMVNIGQDVGSIAQTVTGSSATSDSGNSNPTNPQS